MAAKEATNRDGKGRFLSGHGIGRPKGSRNRLTQDVADGFLEAWEEIGGSEHMAEWARENPTAFYSLLARLLPKELKRTVESHCIDEEVGLDHTLRLVEEATRQSEVG